MTNHSADENRRQRRRVLAGLAAVGWPPLWAGEAAGAGKQEVEAGAASTMMDGAVITKPVPRSGERLPVIGLGTSRVFNADVAEAEVARRLTEVLRLFFAAGGKVIDSSPMYGLAERALGELLALLQGGYEVFSATKVWTDGAVAGTRQMRQSLRYWGHQGARFDLMQIHNLRDWRAHLATLEQWKAEGLVRYIGITTYGGYDHAELADILKRHKAFDFVQLSYNVLNRKAERTLFPIIRDKGLAVLANRPFQRGSLFRLVKGKPLPAWAGQWGMASWAQVFLKFIVSRPEVTCAIPATSKPRHMTDNMGAQRGPLPDAGGRKVIADYFDAL